MSNARPRRGNPGATAIVGTRRRAEPPRTGSALQRAADPASNNAADEESRREVATILARVRGNTAQQAIDSNLKEEVPSVAVPLGAAERARDFHRGQRPLANHLPASPPPAQQSQLHRQVEVNHRRDASFAAEAAAEAEEDEALRAHETMLREQMQAVAQRQAELKLKRLEASLREV